MDYSNQNQQKSYAIGHQYPADALTKAVEPTSTPIRDKVSQAEQLLSELHEAINSLESRFDTALSPMPPSTTNAAASTPTPPMSHVLGRLQILNDGYEHAIHRLRTLAKRCEL